MLLLFTVALLRLSPVPVQITGDVGHWQLVRGGQPYVIKGGGGNGSIALFKTIGGNSIRTWGVDQLPQLLTEADREGVTIAAGIWLAHRDALDYSNATLVAAQTEAVRRSVNKYKDEPSILVWGVGNEMENGNDTPELWQAVGAAVHAAKLADPSHPVMTVVAEVSQQKIDHIKRYVPDLDLLGVNSYGGLPSLAKRLKEYGWTKPYVVTEFGPLGHWERPKTAWGAPLEQNSTEKARFYQQGYNASIGGQPGWCLGCYAFFWGAKQEATPTWFGMVLSNGDLLESADVMGKFWTGSESNSPAPRIQEFVLSGDHDSVTPGLPLRAKIAAEGESLTYHWEVRREVAERRPDGTGEAVPAVVKVIPAGANSNQVEFSSPAAKGAYRLYVMVETPGHRAATANIPFRVQ